MTLREQTQVKVIQRYGWVVRFCWSVKPYFEAKKGTITVTGFTPDELFDVWSQIPQVIEEVLGVKLENFKEPEVTVHEQIVSKEV